ncbi:MepB family protein [Flavobacterium artemisiae]|uniref:MepB family protein n=1 Tax=Flavobacterium artemisiae TaxID=2126556 RepID=A0ABW4H956_9FLAO
MTFKTHSIPFNLLQIQELFSNHNLLELSLLTKENESEGYNAYRFEIQNKKICYREAKITPTKTGQFVTLWKRNQKGIIAPFDDSDPINFVMISVRKDENWGMFIFPKKALAAKGIFSTITKEGIRATRVYPPWDETSSKQAQKTQKWQLDYFFSLDKNNFNLNQLQELLSEK